MKSPLEMNDNPEQDRLSEALQVSPDNSVGAGSAYENELDVLSQTNNIPSQSLVGTGSLPQSPDDLLETPYLQILARRSESLTKTIKEIEAMPPGSRSPQVDYTLELSKRNRGRRQEELDNRRAAVERMQKGMSIEGDYDDDSLKMDIQYREQTLDIMKDLTALSSGKLGMEEIIQIGTKYDEKFYERYQAQARTQPEPTMDDELGNLQEEENEQGDF
jgi:hypothetical protein